MSVMAVLTHGASGWLDEFVQLGLPLLVLLGFYLWANRKSGRKGPR
ncbi:MAG TPA: hypothetical protein VFM06_10445 [Candidatus Limnocylindria bacterium]|nr:hypothetical protein [Candidatus Limnocylindria bacterium]